MSDNTHEPSWAGEPIAILSNRLREYGPTTPLGAQAIAAANGLVVRLQAAIEVWEATQGKKELQEHRGVLTDELDSFRGTLHELSDAIVQMGGSVTKDSEREFRDAVADVDWTHEASALQSVVRLVRRQLVRSCADVEKCEPVPLATRVAVQRLGSSLQATPSF